MANYVTNIKNPEIIASLPDISILADLFDEGLTTDGLKGRLNSVSFRKKLQTILSFKMSDTVRELLSSQLRTGYIQLKRDEGCKVEIIDKAIFVDDKLITYSIDSFADGIFADDSFSALFFTPEVIDVVLSSKDNSFIESVLKVGNFWNRAVEVENLIAHLEENHLEVITPYIETLEVPYVKYVCYKAGLEVPRYRDISFIIEDSHAMDAIALVPAAVAVERASQYGISARILYSFGKQSLDEVSDSEDVLSLIKKDSALRSIVVDFNAVQALKEGSIIERYILNNDIHFGHIVSEKLKIETSIKMSNLFFDETYAEELKLFIGDDRLVEMLFRSNLYPTFASVFFEVFSGLNISGQQFSMMVDDTNGTLSMSYATREFNARQLQVSLDSFSETKASSIVDVETEKRVFFVPYTFSDKTVLATQTSHKVELTNPNNYNLYGEFAEDRFNTLIGSDGHIFGIQSDGKVVSSRFSISLNLSSENILSISVLPQNVFIITEETIHAFGNFGEDKEDIIQNVIVNKDDILGLTYFRGAVIALKNDHTLVTVTKDDLVPFLEDVKVLDLMVIRDKLLLLKEDGVLIEWQDEETVVEIASDITAITYSQMGIVATIVEEERAIFNYEDSWLVYDFNVNNLFGN